MQRLLSFPDFPSHGSVALSARSPILIHAEYELVALAQAVVGVHNTIKISQYLVRTNNQRRNAKLRSEPSGKGHPKWVVQSCSDSCKTSEPML